MTGDVLRQAEPLGVSGDELLVFSRCRSDPEADAPVAVLVDDEPREVLPAHEEASVRRVPIVRSCFWKGQADVRRSIEQLWFHRHIIDEAAARRAPPTAGSGSDVVEDLPSRRPHSVVAVIGHPLAASGQFQMATNTDRRAVLVRGPGRTMERLPGRSVRPEEALRVLAGCVPRQLRDVSRGAWLRSRSRCGRRDRRTRPRSPMAVALALWRPSLLLGEHAPRSP